MRRPFKFSSGSVSNRQFKIAAMAEAFNLPVVSHLYPEVSVHPVAGFPNGLTVEYMPWTNRLFKETPKIADGKIEVAARPGLGLEFDEKVCAQCAAWRTPCWRRN